MKVLLNRLLTKNLSSHAVMIFDEDHVSIKQSHRPFRSVTLPADEARALLAVLSAHFAETPKTEESEVGQ